MVQKRRAAFAANQSKKEGRLTPPVNIKERRNLSYFGSLSTSMPKVTAPIGLPFSAMVTLT